MQWRANVQNRHKITGKYYDKYFHNFFYELVIGGWGKLMWVHFIVILL